jgi:hypothetical protein
MTSTCTAHRHRYVDHARTMARSLVETLRLGETFDQYRAERERYDELMSGDDAEIDLASDVLDIVQALAQESPTPS